MLARTSESESECECVCDGLSIYLYQLLRLGAIMSNSPPPKIPNVPSDVENSDSGDDEDASSSKTPVRNRKRCKTKSGKSLLGLFLSPKRNEGQTDIKLCIICQKPTQKLPISKTRGRSKILNCAEVKRDFVYDRILATNSQNTFVYRRGNDCYKN